MVLYEKNVLFSWYQVCVKCPSSVCQWVPNSLIVRVPTVFSKDKDFDLTHRYSDPEESKILYFQKGDSVDGPVLEITMGKCS